MLPAARVWRARVNSGRVQPALRLARFPGGSVEAPLGQRRNYHTPQREIAFVMNEVMNFDEVGSSVTPLTPSDVFRL